MSDDKVRDFQIWIRKSREAAKKNPECYLVNYDFEMDEKNVWMTKEEYDLLLRNVGSYNGTIPTGQYCGKLFVRHKKLMWYGIAKSNLVKKVQLNARIILIRSYNERGPAHPPKY